eukprot:TRINITY_DN3124_c0_g1_i1.p1 TRINITY_DN3124_c0_g1~~TRINITY_DN3124_c0_g1_i1.p1  ORF type:complete len:1297 (-),score=386.13 TRINITY_DN3124_c0_g1_i1:1743-5633(-)
MNASRLATFRPPPSGGGEFGVSSACFHTRRSTVFLCFGRLVQEYDLQMKIVRNSFMVPSNVRACVALPSLSLLALGLEDGEISLHDMDSREMFASIRPEKSSERKPVEEICGSDTEPCLFYFKSGSKDAYQISFSDDISVPTKISSQKKPIARMCSHPNRPLVATLGLDGTIQLVNYKLDEVIAVIEVKEGKKGKTKVLLTEIAFVGDRSVLCAGTLDGRIFFWDCSVMNPGSLITHRQTPNAIVSLVFDTNIGHMLVLDESLCISSYQYDPGSATVFSPTSLSFRLALEHPDPKKSLLSKQRPRLQLQVHSQRDVGNVFYKDGEEAVIWMVSRGLSDHPMAISTKAWKRAKLISRQDEEKMVFPSSCIMYYSGTVLRYDVSSGTLHEMMQLDGIGVESVLMNAFEVTSNDRSVVVLVFSHAVLSFCLEEKKKSTVHKISATINGCAPLVANDGAPCLAILSGEKKNICSIYSVGIDGKLEEKKEISFECEEVDNLFSNEKLGSTLCCQTSPDTHLQRLVPLSVWAGSDHSAQMLNVEADENLKLHDTLFFEMKQGEKIQNVFFSPPQYVIGERILVQTTRRVVVLDRGFNVIGEVGRVVISCCFIDNMIVCTSEKNVFVLSADMSESPLVSLGGVGASLIGFTCDRVLLGFGQASDMCVASRGVSWTEPCVQSLLKVPIEHEEKVKIFRWLFKHYDAVHASEELAQRLQLEGFEELGLSLVLEGPTACSWMTRFDTALRFHKYEIAMGLLSAEYMNFDPSGNRVSPEYDRRFAQLGELARAHGMYTIAARCFDKIGDVWGLVEVFAEAECVDGVGKILSLCSSDPEDDILVSFCVGYLRTHGVDDENKIPKIRSERIGRRNKFPLHEVDVKDQRRESHITVDGSSEKWSFVDSLKLVMEDENGKEIAGFGRGGWDVVRPDARKSGSKPGTSIMRQNSMDLGNDGFDDEEDAKEMQEMRKAGADVDYGEKEGGSSEKNGDGEDVEKDADEESKVDAQEKARQQFFAEMQGNADDESDDESDRPKRLVVNIASEPVRSKAGSLSAFRLSGPTGPRASRSRPGATPLRAPPPPSSRRQGILPPPSVAAVDDGAQPVDLMKAGMREMESGDFSLALTHVEKCILLLSSAETLNIPSLRMAVRYKLALNLALAMRSSKRAGEPPAKAALLSTKMSSIELLPRHRFLCARLAIQRNMEIENYATAILIAKEITTVIPEKARGFVVGKMKECEENGGKDAIDFARARNTGFCWKALEFGVENLIPCSVCLAEFNAKRIDRPSKCVYCLRGEIFPLESEESPK